MPESTRVPARTLLVVAAAQGLMLWLLSRTETFGTWPSSAPLWKYPLWSLAIVVPQILLLSLNRGNTIVLARLVGAFAVIVALLAAYIGSQAEPYAELYVENLTAIYGISMTVAAFKALMYIQQRSSSASLSYPLLFSYSWRNFLVTAFAVAFVAAFWLLLVLWAVLFETIGIAFFRNLFWKEWFIFIVLSTANGVGIVIFRRLTGVIDSITRLLRGLIKLLLPVALLVAVMFVATLPFVGLDALWATGHGTALLLWLLALVLFFVNAVYQDGREDPPYPLLVHRLIYLAILVMPVFAALSFYGLSLRLGQYGWTVERAWAFVAWLLLSLFAVGYVVGILRKRDDWTEQLAKVNIAMGLVVLAVLWLANSPLLDFRKISLASQLDRVESGDIELADFDFWYVQRNLARPGFLAIEKIKDEVGDSDPDLLARIATPYPATQAQVMHGDRNYWGRLHFLPEPFEVPVGLRAQIERAYPAIRKPGQAFLVRAELSEHAGMEYLFFLAYNDQPQQGRIFYWQDSQWQSTQVLPSLQIDPHQAGESRSLAERDLSVEQPTFQLLKIGDVTFHVAPPPFSGVHVVNPNVEIAEPETGEEPK